MLSQPPGLAATIVLACATLMELALVIAIGSVAVGLVAAIAARARLWVLAPVRAFAVVAVAAAIALHILPESVDGGGWAVLIVAALGLIAPIVLGRATASLQLRHRRVAAELGYVAVLVHQWSDGLALGAATGGPHTHWDLLIGVGAHTVPLIAVLALTFAELGGTRAVLVRSLGLLAATLLGLLLTRADDTFLPSAEPWLNAAVSGLLLHILVHDSDEREVPAATRPLEALGAFGGALLPFVTGGHEHGAITHALRAHLGVCVVAAAPWIVAGAALAALVAPGHRRRPRAIAAIATGPLTLLGVVAAAYVATAITDDAGAPTGAWRAVGLAAAGLLAALALARIARGGFMAWLGTGHSHDHAPVPASAHAEHAAHAHDHDHAH